MGATTTSAACASSGCCFNPRARDGRDLAPSAFANADHIVSTHAPVMGATLRLVRPQIAEPVSTHAPVMGATLCSLPTNQGPHCFNPRARDGRDWFAPAGHRSAGRFNPRARDGRDHGNQQHHTGTHTGFNPRARDGRDLVGVLSSDMSAPVSTHAPVMGATNISADFGECGRVSTHAPVMGATRKLITVSWVPSVFQPTRP